MKGIDKTNPDRWRENDSTVRLTELFLDFDPVAPEAPMEKSDGSPGGDQDQAPSGDTMAVITIVSTRSCA